MATSKVEIWNMALGLLHTRNLITSATESSLEAEQCRLYYDAALDAVLSRLDWGFAHKQNTLALTVTEPTGWVYEYTYPSDCVQPLRIYNPADPHGNTLPPLPYEVAKNQSGGGKVIWCDYADAELVYTQSITDVSLFSGQFVIGLAARLAVYLAVALLGDHAKARELMGVFQYEMGMAEANDANMGARVNEADAKWIQDRA